MKSCLNFFYITAFFLLIGKAGISQLPSDRPMSAIAPKYLKPGAPKSQPSAEELPSAKPMKEVKAPKGRVIPKKIANKEPDPKKLPSQSKTRIKDLARKPKVKN